MLTLAFVTASAPSGAKGYSQGNSDRHADADVAQCRADAHACTGSECDA
ncbi:MAG: hypothetical protein OXG79_01825 [Chloroflexi bacterium]|nr:hypothetical protein [Chloroflexota bacterium]MCY4111921.1 hypothetical protein [Chloroflexota bacterium]